MVRKVDIDTAESIDVAEFIHHARAVDLRDEAELFALAPSMRKLANNRAFLAAFIESGLEDIGNFQRDNLYSSRSYILGSVTERSFLRMAIWAPPAFSSRLDEDNFFSYERAHNHDFSLLTAGYIGPGYTTTVFRLDRKPVGYVGESVALSSREVIQLEPGRVLLYEAGTDVHTQHPPSGLSVSLNLIVDQADANPQQLYFDTDAMTVLGYVGNTKLKRAAFMRFAAALATDAVSAMLSDLADHHPCSTTRLYAYRALALADPDLSEELAERMDRDPSDVVRMSTRLLDDRFADSHIWG